MAVNIRPVCVFFFWHCSFQRGVILATLGQVLVMPVKHDNQSAAAWGAAELLQIINTNKYKLEYIF